MSGVSEMWDWGKRAWYAAAWRARWVSISCDVLGSLCAETEHWRRRRGMRRKGMDGMGEWEREPNCVIHLSRDPAGTEPGAI